MRNMSTVILLTTAMLLHLSPTSAQDGQFWRVEKSKASCFLSNIEVYVALNERPTVIFLDDCPQVDLSASLERMARNSLLPQPAPSNKSDTVIVYTTEEIACLRQLSIDLSSDVVLIPKSPKC